MGTPHVFSPAASFPEAAADRSIRRYSLLAAAGLLVAPPMLWWPSYTRQIQGATIKTDVYVPMNAPQVHEGSDVVFQRMSEIFRTVTRSEATIACEVNLAQAAEADFGQWAYSPQGMAIAIQKRAGRRLGALLNAAHTITDYTGSVFAATTDIKLVHPKKKNLGAKWRNAWASSALTGPNLKRAIQSLQTRRGLDDYPLGFGQDATKLTLLVPSGMLQTAKDLVEVATLVPATDGTSSGGGNTNTSYRCCRVEMCPDMRSDMWCVVDAASNGSGYEIFVRVMGSMQEGPPQVNDKLEPDGGSPGVPYLEPLIWLTDSDKYKNTGMVGAGYRIREGFDLLSPHAISFNYTGAADAAYTI